MSYQSPVLIGRQGYAGVGGFTDFFKNLGQGVWDYAKGQGAMQAMQAQQAAQQPLPSSSGGISTTTVLLVGVGIVGAVLLFKSMKK